MTDNLTLLDLITSHVEDGNYEEAEQLAAIGEYLEDCFHWELNLYPESEADSDV